MKEYSVVCLTETDGELVRVSMTADDIVSTYTKKEIDDDVFVIDGPRIYWDDLNKENDD